MKKIKELDVPWLGKIPEDWMVLKLKFICKINTGSKDTQDKLSDGKYPFFVRSSNIENLNEFTHDEEAIMTAGDGAGVGKVFHYYKGKFAAHQRVYIFSGFKNVCGKYLYYYLMSNLKFEVLLGGAKSTVDSIRKPMLSEFPVVFPELEEQKKIVRYLDAKNDQMDNLIKSKEKSIELLRQQRQAIITEAITKGLDSSTKMKNSGVEWIGKIPKHWEVNKVKFKFGIRKIIQPIENPTVLSLTQRGLKIKDLEDFSGQHAESYDKYQKVEINDYVMNGMDLLTGYVDCSPFEGVTSPDYRVFRIKDNAECHDYFLKYFQICYFAKIFYGHGQGVSNFGRWRLQTDVFKEFPVPVPPKDEQFKISKYLKVKEQEIEKSLSLIKMDIEKLKEYRQALIYEVVTGKVDVT